MAIRSTPRDYFDESAPVHVTYGPLSGSGQPIYYNPPGDDTGKLVILGIVSVVALLAFFAYLSSRR